MNLWIAVVAVCMQTQSLGRVADCVSHTTGKVFSTKEECEKGKEAYIAEATCVEVKQFIGLRKENSNGH